MLAFLRRLGNGCNHLGKLLFIHNSTCGIHLSAEEFISAVSLNQADIPFCFAQVVIGDGGRFNHLHPIVHILHHHTSAGGIGNSIVMGSADVGVHVDSPEQIQGFVHRCGVLQQVADG